MENGIIISNSYFSFSCITLQNFIFRHVVKWEIHWLSRFSYFRGLATLDVLQSSLNHTVVFCLPTLFFEKCLQTRMFWTWWLNLCLLLVNMYFPEFTENIVRKKGDIFWAMRRFYTFPYFPLESLAIANLISLSHKWCSLNLNTLFRNKWKSLFYHQR